MKLGSVIFVAVIGGLVGAGTVLLVDKVQVAGPVGREGDLDRLTSENHDLRARLSALEEQAGAAKHASPEGGASLPAQIERDLLDKARTAAREEAARFAVGEPTRIAAEEKRSAAIAELLELVWAPHEDTRQNGIRRLSRMGASEASGEVLEALADESALVRTEAAAFFEDIWSPAALEPLVGLMNGEHDGVAEQALDALCKSGDERALLELEAYYLRGPVLGIAYEAGKALEENHRPAVLAGGAARFRAALGSAEPSARRIGLSGLRHWGSAADAGLVRPLESDEDEGVRTEAVKTLEAWGLEPSTGD